MRLTCDLGLQVKFIKATSTIGNREEGYSLVRHGHLHTNIRILELEPILTKETLRTPLKFGAAEVTESTMLTVRAKVENRAGQVGEGWGQILLSVQWAFPTGLVSYDLRDQAMQELSRRICGTMANLPGFYHPLDLYVEFKPHLRNLAKAVSHELKLAVDLPILAALVCASSMDAALHDAFGRVNGVSAYEGCGPDFMPHDLSVYLGEEFKGKYPVDYLRSSYEEHVPIFHLVGGVDKLREVEVNASDPQDGLPVSLERWIKRDGLFCFKVKLRGTDIDWDVARTSAVADVVAESLTRHKIHVGKRAFILSIDSNELCESPDAVLEYLAKLKELSPLAYEHLLYIEQPTERDLSAHRFDMRKLAAVKPVLADEGVVDLESLDLAKELGWSGIALKTCKGHSAVLLSIAKASAAGLLYSVQDLTNPSLAFVHSAGLAARSHPLNGVEYNARQYLPQAGLEVQKLHNTLFQVQEGYIRTNTISGVGFGYHPHALR
jgi:L-alanine-DL-glutamate epimerase-like enolase superfamily enzyme